MGSDNCILVQCACCDFKYKKSIGWLEKTESFRCVCGEELDVDELLTDFYTSGKKKDKLYTIYQK